MKYISSRDNPVFKHFRHLGKVSGKPGEPVLLEGIHLVQAWLEQGLPVTRGLISSSALHDPEIQDLWVQHAELDWSQTDDGLLAQLSTLPSPSPILLEVTARPTPELTTLKGDGLILDAVQDAGNVGTLLRTAAAAGIKWVVTTPGTATIWSTKVLRAGMGAQMQLDIVEHLHQEAWGNLPQQPIFAGSLYAENNLYDLPLTQTVTWVVGNEGAGISEAWQALAHPFRIPQPGGMESLNVAIAAGIALFEMVRQRRST
jgi:RNA methyltransferase, TrmH family